MDYKAIQNSAIQKYSVTIVQNSTCWKRMHAHMDGTRRICKWNQADSYKSTFGLFHEIGHIEANKKGMKRFEQEQSATQWCIDELRRNNLPIKRKLVAKYRAYIEMTYARGKRRGLKKVEVDLLDAALQAFRFTTYHGNLNELIAQEEYAVRNQMMMDETVGKLSGVVNILRDYLPIMIAGQQPVTLTYPFQGNEVRTVKSPELVGALRQKGVSYQETDLKQELKEQGLGTDWVDPYVKRMEKKK